MATIGGSVTEPITSEVDLFKSIMQQNVIENEFNREYAPLATIQPGMAIEFTVKSTNDLYLDLKNSRLHEIGKITKAVKTNIDANTAAPINLTLHSMFRKIGLELTGKISATRASFTRIAQSWKVFSTFARKCKTLAS